MTLELIAIPLALAAGVVGVLSPCVWPMVPVVMASTTSSGRAGALWLALGLSLSFAVGGTSLTFLLVSTGMDPELFRYFAASLLIAVGLVLLIRRLGDWVTLGLSALSASVPVGTPSDGGSAPAQFGVGALLGIVWLPCVGPTLGAAIGLASMGQSMGMAFVVMLAYGIGTAGVLLAAGLVSGRVLARWRPRLMSGGGTGKKILGWTILIIGVLVLTSADKFLEALAVGMLPDWVYI